MPHALCVIFPRLTVFKKRIGKFNELANDTSRGPPNDDILKRVFKFADIGPGLMVVSGLMGLD
jgi:hypothetical protein